MARLANIPGFENFDDPKVYKRTAESLLKANSGNFVIEFDSSTATSAQDLDGIAIEKVLQTSSSGSTRWINICGPERQRQKPIVERLSAHYGFSPRLLAIMCSDHGRPIPQSPEAGTPTHTWNKLHFTTRHMRTETQTIDPEKDGDGMVATTSPNALDISHYKVVKEVWHYCSVDWGEKYLCIGYNSLSDPTTLLKGKTRKSSHSDSEDEDHTRNKPRGIRIWTWLVLCDDATVISIYETPFPNQVENLTEREQILLHAIRRNIQNVLMQLSQASYEQKIGNPINKLDIRPGLASDQMSRIKIADSPSLLFHYLFDDWYASYALVAKSEHQYAQRLEQLRRDMFLRPQVPLIEQLHQYGRELAVLKRMYQSYALIIERILNRQKPVDSIQSNASTIDGNDSSEVRTFAAPLSAPAIVRFERLLDRINLFAISEIQECLDEKESLVFLTFNLLAHKESQAVERLTRVTILLAKITILFMPVSIMTAYFSTQLTDLVGKYTIQTYWICFAVIIGVTFLLLLAYGLISNTVEGKPIYDSLEKIAWNAVRGRWKASKPKDKSKH